MTKRTREDLLQDLERVRDEISAENCRLEEVEDLLHDLAIEESFIEEELEEMDRDSCSPMK